MVDSAVKDVIEIQNDETQQGVANVTLEKKIEPVIVKYCALCKFPEEYCEYSHPILLKKDDTKTSDKDENLAPTTEKDKTTSKDATTAASTHSEEKKEETKEKKSDKKKKETLPQIIIELSKRGKKKHTTYVSNLEKYGLNLKDVAKMFSKKFACSSTVTKEDNGTECITLTGEFGYDIVEYLTESFTNIKAENCQVKEPKEKK